MIETFAGLLAGYRMTTGISRNKLAHLVGVDPSYLTRIENGDREPPRFHIVEALARVLNLNDEQRNHLLVSAGYAPVTVAQLGSWDDALQDVADVLTDIRLSPTDRDEFRLFIRMAATRWRAAPIAI